MKVHGLILFVIFTTSAAAITASFKEDIKSRKLMSNENKFIPVDSLRLDNLNGVRINGASDGASGVNAGADQSKDPSGSDENDGSWNGSRTSTSDSHHSTDLIHWKPGTN